MARANHDRQRIAFHFSDGQRGIVNLALDETEVGISSMDSLGDLLRVCDRDVQIDAWMGLAKRLDAWKASAPSKAGRNLFPVSLPMLVSRPIAANAIDRNVVAATIHTWEPAGTEWLKIATDPKTFTHAIA
jgi:hypothetical protein